MARMENFLDSREFARMTRAIEFIEREYQRQPKLAEIARHVRLSEFHFNRLFRRWTGLTPKQYLAEVTSRAAGAALRAEPSVMEAAHSVGLSGGGRLHDLTVTLDAMSPGEIRAGGSGVEIRHGVADTPFGSAFVAETPRGLLRLSFLDGRSDATAAAGHQRPLVLELMRHMFLSMRAAAVHPHRSDGFLSSSRSSARVAMFPLISGWAGTM